MRKAGIMMSILGAAAFAALLAWGLTFGSGTTVRANDATATPTPTGTAAATGTATPAATGTATPAATGTAPAATATPGAFCAPQIPGTYHGAVTLNGVPAPVGTKITVSRGGVQFGQTTVETAGQYVVNVPEPMPAEPPCFEGTSGPLAFTCDGAVAAETPNFAAALQAQDLTCGAAPGSPTPTPTPKAEATATPTPTPKAEATATPTATPKATATATPPPPPPGLGGTASGDGFMWWPLAMAAAALTSVAGLFTARWARR